MIISHRHKFIYLKTEKTASTSLYNAFLEIVRKHDEPYPADQAVRRRLLREHGTLERFSFIGIGHWQRAWFPALTGLHRHAQARDVREFLGPKLFGRYLVITSERNPYDRQVSLYNHRRRKRGDGDLANFSRDLGSPVYGALHHNRLDNWSIYTLGGRVCADIVIQFAHLHDDFLATLRRIGVSYDRDRLPHSNGRQRSRPAEYRYLYTDEARAIVASWYRNEIEHFGYEF